MDALAGAQDGWVDGLWGVAPLLRVLEELFGRGRVGAEELVVDLVAEFGGEAEEGGLGLRGHGLLFGGCGRGLVGSVALDSRM